jgi:hypothetical protein
MLARARHLAHETRQLYATRRCCSSTWSADLHLMRASVAIRLTQLAHTASVAVNLPVDYQDVTPSVASSGECCCPPRFHPVWNRRH